MAADNRSRPGQDPIDLRIGINIGDIVIDGDDIFGDGVNAAARLEGQASRGGILVSDAVLSQIKGKVSAPFTDAGELLLKNIQFPLRAWRWDGEACVEPVVAMNPEAERDARPSVAVLPFTNMSGDPEQEYFSDGITEDIITDLSKISGLMVVARNSASPTRTRILTSAWSGANLGSRRCSRGQSGVLTTGSGSPRS